MTDYSLSALGDLMDDILDNAIRRYVTEFEWYGTADEGFQGNGWTGTLPATFGPTGKVRLKQQNNLSTSVAPPPPGAEYVGRETVGQIMYDVYEIDAFEVLYKPWIDRLNDAFEGWRTLPDPADFATVRAQLEDAVDALTPEAQADGGFTFVDVDVSSALERMSTWISPQSDQASSELLYAFDAVYGVGRITGVMVNQAQVVAGLGLAVTGEERVWTKTRSDIMKIARDAAEVLDVSAGGDIQIDLGVVKSFVDLVGHFVPKQFQVLTAVASEGLGFLDSVIPKPKVESKQLSVSGSTADEIFSSLEKAIRDLETAVYDEESEIVTKLRLLDDIMAGGGEVARDADDFHLHPGAGIDETYAHEAEIRFTSSMVQSIGSREVPVIASAFLKAAEHAATSTGSGIWSRDASIGYGSYGPYDAWKTVLDQFDAITTGSARELVTAGQMLAVAAGWIQDSDEESLEALQGLTDELARGETSWSHG